MDQIAGLDPKLLNRFSENFLGGGGIVIVEGRLTAGPDLKFADAYRRSNAFLCLPATH